MNKGIEFLQRPFTPKEMKAIEDLVADDLVDLIQRDHVAGRDALLAGMRHANEKMEKGVGLAPYALLVLCVAVFLFVPIFVEHRAPSLAEGGCVVLAMALGIGWIAWYYRRWQMEFLRFYAAEQAFFFILADRRGDWFEAKVDDVLSTSKAAIDDMKEGMNNLNKLIARLPESPEAAAVLREMKRTWDHVDNPHNVPATPIPTVKPGDDVPETTTMKA